jgi:hypothetical protein
MPYATLSTIQADSQINRALIFDLTSKSKLILCPYSLISIQYNTIAINNN